MKITRVIALLTTLSIWNLYPAASSSSAAASAKPSRRTSWCTLPDSICIPGERGKAMEKLNLNAVDRISKSSFKDHIKEMHAHNLPWIMAAFWWVQGDGTLARDYADANWFNRWRLECENDGYKIARKLHPLHQREIIYPEYFAFELVDKKLTIEKLGSEYQLCNHEKHFGVSVILQQIFKITAAPDDPTNCDGYALAALADTYDALCDTCNAVKWHAKAAKQNNEFALRYMSEHYMDRKDYEKALETSLKFYALRRQECSISKDDPALVTQIGYLYEQTNQLSEAIKWYKETGSKPSVTLDTSIAYLHLLSIKEETLEDLRGIIDLCEFADFLIDFVGFSFERSEGFNIEEHAWLKDKPEAYKERFISAFKMAKNNIT